MGLRRNAQHSCEWKSHDFFGANGPNSHGFFRPASQIVAIILDEQLYYDEHVKGIHVALQKPNQQRLFYGSPYFNTNRDLYGVCGCQVWMLYVYCGEILHHTRRIG
eukprot:2476744-Amphidinium_carterae.1